MGALKRRLSIRRAVIVDVAPKALSSSFEKYLHFISYQTASSRNDILSSLRRIEKVRESFLG